MTCAFKIRVVQAAFTRSRTDSKIILMGTISDHIKIIISQVKEIRFKY